MAAIRKLSAAVVNKIAAGEVIERPASVVKELLENSIDAGAGRVDVTVERGGADAIVIAGRRLRRRSGRTPLGRLFRTPRARSPRRTICFTSTRSAFAARPWPASPRSRDFASVRGRPTPTPRRNSPWTAETSATCDQPSRAPGTTIEVRDLFFTTPVRRKFLRTTQTEVGHVAEAVQRLALANPGVGFSLRHNERSVLDLPAVDDVQARIAGLFGEEIAGALIEVASGEGDVRLAGYVAQPEVSRGNNRTQYVFLNGRFIRDRALQHALAEAYRGLLMVGRHPICFLNLTMPPELVDVNVHPTKLEVRFVDGGKIYAQLLSTLRNRFLSSDLTARWTAERAERRNVRTAVQAVPAGAGGLGESVSQHRPRGGSRLAVGDRPAAGRRTRLLGRRCNDQARGVAARGTAAGDGVDCRTGDAGAGDAGDEHLLGRRDGGRSAGDRSARPA